MSIATYANVGERGQFLLDTFGSHPYLWDTPDELHFDPASRNLVGAEFQIAVGDTDADDRARVPAAPLVRPGGLRADEDRDFRLEVTTELCRAPADSELTCLRDLPGRSPTGPHALYAGRGWQAKAYRSTARCRQGPGMFVVPGVGSGEGVLEDGVQEWLIGGGLHGAGPGVGLKGPARLAMRIIIVAAKSRLMTIRASPRGLRGL
ncbi:hypothetical protein ACFXDJ_14410 [Streptomyces sp. NPDC059443]|uniref:hypothetical protein n=1 Tax=unclassified Streptomyces TaxID=2593676 RepID=UPI00367EC07C